jgi:hypothetical protein
MNESEDTMDNRTVGELLVEGARMAEAQRDAARLMLAALQTLLPVAQAFEKQASRGSAGRRGGPVFEQARAAISAAEAAGIAIEEK